MRYRMLKYKLANLEKNDNLKIVYHRSQSRGLWWEADTFIYSK